MFFKQLEKGPYRSIHRTDLGEVGSVVKLRPRAFQRISFRQNPLGLSKDTDRDCQLLKMSPVLWVFEVVEHLEFPKAQIFRYRSDFDEIGSVGKPSFSVFQRIPFRQRARYSVHRKMRTFYFDFPPRRWNVRFAVQKALGIFLASVLKLAAGYTEADRRLKVRPGGARGCRYHTW